MFLVSASNASTGQQSKWEFHAGGGPSFPTAPDQFRYNWGTGFNCGGGIGYSINRNLTLLGRLDFNRFGFADESDRIYYGYYGYGYGAVSGGATYVMTLSGELRAALLRNPRGVRPYFSCGTGVLGVSHGGVRLEGYEGPKTIGRSTETTLLLLTGVGIEVPIRERLGLFVEGRYAWGFTKGTQILPVKLGVIFR